MLRIPIALVFAAAAWAQPDIPSGKKILPRRRNLWVVCQRLAVRLIEELPELPAGGLEGSLLFLGVAVMENGAAVLDHVGQNFLHWHLSERRRVVEFGDELSA